MKLEVLTPGGGVISEGMFGRGKHGQADPKMSRTQFELSKVQEELHLKNKGRNPLLIAELLDGAEKVVDFLLTEESAQLNEAVYFYIPTRKETTTYRVRKSIASRPQSSVNATPTVLSAANLAACSSAPMAGATIDVASSSEEDDAGPQQKRPCMQPISSAGPSTEADFQARDRGGPSRPPSGNWAPPFSLMKVDGIPDAGNMPPGNLRLGDLVCGGMQFVLVSSFSIDFGWLLNSCPDLLQARHLQVVCHGGKRGREAEITARLDELKSTASIAGLVGEERFSAHSPPLLDDYGTHHSKYFLIEYKTGLRVVIHTANLIHCDCHNKTQGIWVQDFPRKDARSPRSSDFEVDLVDYLEALHIPVNSKVQSAISRCRLHDFSSARARIIASTPGRHQSSKAIGHLALRRALQLETFDPIFRRAPVFAQFSSLGSLTATWLHNEFQRDTLCAGNYTGSKGERVALGAGPNDASGLQLIWPTVSDVQNCLEGWAGGHSLHGEPKKVNRDFLNSLWHSFGGQPMMRHRASPHIKSFGRYVSVPGKGTRLAWLLVTSHNLSKAAWGELQKGGTSLYVRSYELGALMLPSLEDLYRSHRHCGFSCTSTPPIVLPPAKPGGGEVQFWTRSISDGAGVAPPEGECHMPLPYKLPPDPHPNEANPWMSKTHWPGLDCQGKTLTFF